MSVIAGALTVRIASAVDDAGWAMRGSSIRATAGEHLATRKEIRVIRDCLPLNRLHSLVIWMLPAIIVLTRFFTVS